MKSKLKSTTSILRYRLFECFAPGTNVGKTLLATFVAAYLRASGYRVVFVRIESRSANRQGADLLIDAEDFSQSARLAGAAAGVLRPLFQLLQRAVKEDLYIVLDWGGGLASYRNESFAAVRFDERLADWGIRGLSIVPTSSAADRMHQAADALTKTALVAPNLDRIVVLNQKLGPFDFLPGTAEQLAFAALQVAAEGVPIIDIPAVSGESLKSCDDANLSMIEVIEADVPALASRLGEMDAIAAAIQSHIAAWWTASQKKLISVISVITADEK